MFYVGVITAGMTAFYVFRAIFLTFFGEYRGTGHPHESPITMTGPLVILALLSLVGGYYFNIPHYLEGMFQTAEEGNAMFLQIISVVTALFGIAIAGHLYLGENNMADNLARTFKYTYEIIYNKYFVDEMYEAGVVRPVLGISRVVLWRGVDQGLVDGLVNGIGRQIAKYG